jgi:hypothetical protein
MKGSFQVLQKGIYRGRVSQPRKNRSHQEMWWSRGFYAKQILASQSLPSEFSYLENTVKRIMREHMVVGLRALAKNLV